MTLTELYETGRAFLIADGHHGAYIPQMVCMEFDFQDELKEDVEILTTKHPVNEHYLDAWANVLDNGVIEIKLRCKVLRYFLHQAEDGDVWAIKEGMELSEDDESDWRRTRQ
jgi:hypothetical protein